MRLFLLGSIVGFFGGVAITIAYLSLAILFATNAKVSSARKEIQAISHEDERDESLFAEEKA